MQDPGQPEEVNTEGSPAQLPLREMGGHQLGSQSGEGKGGLTRWRYLQRLSVIVNLQFKHMRRPDERRTYSGRVCA